MKIVEISNLSFCYNGSNSFALRDINLRIDEGEFVLICGESGCGKSTLLKLIKHSLAPRGDRKGEILFYGKDVASLGIREEVCSIGFVMQNPYNQVITDKVWKELSFTLESLGLNQNAMKRKVAEVCGYFGINEWYNKSTETLSGGQKQLINLASIMAVEPKLLILDEPTAFLDPITARNFLNKLKELTSELGTTVIIVEQRLEEVMQLASKIVVMNKATIALIDTPHNLPKSLIGLDSKHKVLDALPTSCKLYLELEGENSSLVYANCPLKSSNASLQCESKAPLTVCEARRFIERKLSDCYCSNTYSTSNGHKENARSSKLKNNKTDNTQRNNCNKAVEVKGAYFCYQRNERDVLKNLDLDAFFGEVLCIMGANGVGKTTLLGAISALNKVYRGSIKIKGKNIKEFKSTSLYRNNIAYLPQNSQLVFVRDKLFDDLMDITRQEGLSQEEGEKQIEEMAVKLNINHLLDMNPFDLSGGESQRAALAKLFLLRPTIILLDEPTKGLDMPSINALSDIILCQAKQGNAVIITTNDVEFAAENADRCAMFFDGAIICNEKTDLFFSYNNFYTTVASRISRGFEFHGITLPKILKSICSGKGNGTNESD